VRLTAVTADDTRAIGAALAGACPRTETFVVVHLCGELGAGKTTLAGGFVQALGFAGPVRSPTYALVEVYEAPGEGAGALTVVHLDLYRLSDPGELEPLGLSEWAQARHVWLIEWPERGAQRLPPPDLVITLQSAPDGHQIDINATTPLGESWIARME
jgi:tRNA threonylcarbamoyladenosine biosynthesis protein TsaE